MPFVITQPCVGVKDGACVDVCPVDCIYDAGDQLVIHPGECIDCYACVPACPVDAIYLDDAVPERWRSYVKKADTWFTEHPEASDGGPTSL